MSLTLNPVENPNTPGYSFPDLSESISDLIDNQILIRDFLCNFDEGIGDLNALTTTDNTSIVAAINELNALIAQNLATLQAALDATNVRIDDTETRLDALELIAHEEEVYVGVSTGARPAANFDIWYQPDTGLSFHRNGTNWIEA